MKDLYSFNRTEEELNTFYEQCKNAYIKIFKRLGIGDKTYYTFASGGAFSKYSHEFQTLCETGEDTIYLDRKKGIAVNQEVYTDDVLAEMGLKKQELEEVRAIEVGNIFPLKTKYSEPLGLMYTDETGQQKPVVMGSYGIGPSRSMATIVEVLSDEKGIVWPKEVAPFKFHLVGLDLAEAEKVYQTLIKNNVEVLYDDREDVSAGEKFADCDLIGCPYRLVVSKKTQGKIEVKRRTEKDSKLVTVADVLAL